MSEELHPLLCDPFYSNLVNDREQAQRLRVKDCTLWVHTASFAPSAIYACGWTQDSKLVIVTVHAYSVNNIVTRKRELLIEDSFPFTERISNHWRTLNFKEISETVELFGIYSGDGIKVAEEWAVEIIYPWWPIGLVTIQRLSSQNIGTEVFGCPIYEFIADWFRCGFSPNGKHLVMFTSEQAEVFSLKE